jgi:hypothetical protein
LSWLVELGMCVFCFGEGKVEILEELDGEHAVMERHYYGSLWLEAALCGEEICVQVIWCMYLIS